jgi:phytoene/squalene synthetase
MLEATSPKVKAALEECRWMITKGSKSFSLAARLFDRETRDAAFFLYGWCRYCDDQVDEAGREESSEQLEQRLRALRNRFGLFFPALSRSRRYLSPCSTSSNITSFRRTMRSN